MSRNRDIEWMLSALLTSLGVAIVLIPDAFVYPFFAGYAGQGLSDNVLGSIMATVGAAWAVGLKINGSWPGGTPWMRLSCAILGSGVWGYLLASIAIAGEFASVPLYGVVVAFSILACGRCGADVVKSVIARRRRRKVNDVVG